MKSTQTFINYFIPVLYIIIILLYSANVTAIPIILLFPVLYIIIISFYSGNVTAIPITTSSSTKLPNAPFYQLKNKLKKNKKEKIQ